MKLSILILTHQRPALFKRCLESALKYVDDSVEIIVNNDSNDIAEIAHPSVRYFYNKFEHLSGVYKFLLEQARGQFVYFLEDDDYLRQNLLEVLDPECDMVVGNYFPMYNAPDRVAMASVYTDRTLTPSEFIEQLNTEHLQLSQHLYKRSTIEQFEFPQDSNIHNDILLTKYAASNCQIIKTVSAVLYCQTIDGGDNISFAETNYGHN